MDAPATPKTETNKRTGLTYQQLLRNLFVQLRDGCGHPDCRTPTCFTCRSSCMSPGSRHARKYTSATAKAIAVELISSEDPSRHACPFMPRSPQTVPDARRQENIDPKSLVQQLFNTRAFEKFLQSSNHSDIYHTSPLEDLTQALERHLVETSRLANTNSNASKTRPDVGLTTDLALQAIQALIAFVPRADLDTWKVVWKVVLDTLSDGLAYGKQRFCKAEVDSSLPILDAFESEPALNLATRLMEVVAASDAAQIAPALRMHGDESDLPAVVSTLRQGILSWFIENSSTFWRESGKSKGEETLQRQTPFETTSIIWLEWLRKCFLKSWDGSYRVSRRSVAGVALLLMHDFCERNYLLALAPPLTSTRDHQTSSRGRSTRRFVLDSCRVQQSPRRQSGKGLARLSRWIRHSTHSLLSLFVRHSHLDIHVPHGQLYQNVSCILRSQRDT